MTDEQLKKFQRCIMVFANAVGALAEIEMMIAENNERSRNDYAQAYGEDEFYDVVRDRRLLSINIKDDLDYDE
jgi:hypothetical protein